MKRILINLTRKQCSELRKATWELKDFGLFAEPLIAAKVMTVFICNKKEFSKTNALLKKIVPKKLRGLILRGIDV